MSTLTRPIQVEGQKYSPISPRVFLVLLLLIVAGAIVRSAIATRLDDFTFDEAYHIAAGVSYIQRADFRLNPEHPPLVKLWVGTLMSAGFHSAQTARSCGCRLSDGQQTPEALSELFQDWQRTHTQSSVTVRKDLRQ